MTGRAIGLLSIMNLTVPTQSLSPAASQPSISFKARHAKQQHAQSSRPLELTSGRCPRTLLHGGHHENTPYKHRAPISYALPHNADQHGPANPLTGPVPTSQLHTATHPSLGPNSHTMNPTHQSNSAAAASTTGSSQPQPPPPPPVLSPTVLVSELLSGQLLTSAQHVFPKVPWGPAQLAQVIVWSGALGVLAAATAANTPQAAALLGADEVRSGALRHLGLEVLCCSLAVAVLFMGLRKSRPRSAGHFRYALDPSVAAAVAVAAAAMYPLADPVLYHVDSSLEQALQLTDQLPDPGATLVAQLRGCVAAGDGVSLAMHLVASCVVGPVWEETFWRGFFLASMTRVLPLPACIALSSAAFAGLHLGPGTALPIAVLSATCDVLYLRTGNLAAPLMFHAGWNAYQLAGIVLVGKDTFV